MSLGIAVSGDAVAKQDDLEFLSYSLSQNLFSG